MIAGKAVTNLLTGRAARSGYVTALDQALVSGTGFATSILVARLGRDEFGAYVLAFTGLMFAAGLQASIVTGPLSVLAPKRESSTLSPYLASTTLLQAALALLLAALAAVAGLIMTLAGEPRAVLVWMLAPAILAWQAQEYARRVLFSQGRASAVLRNDAVTYGGQLTLVLAAYFLGYLSGPVALGIIATSSLAGAVFGFSQLRYDIRPAEGASVRRGLAENWSFARWTLAGSLTQWLSEQVYPFLTAGFLGIAAPGIYKALQNIVALSYILGFAADAIFTPKAAAVYAGGGKAALRSFIAKVYMATAPVGLGFLAFVAVAAEPLLTLLYGNRYEGYGGMLAFMTITYALLFLHRPLAMGLRAQEITRPIFTAYLLSAVATFTAGLWLIHQYGLWGAVGGGLLNVVILVAVLWDAWRHSMREEPA